MKPLAAIAYAGVTITVAIASLVMTRTWQSQHSATVPTPATTSPQTSASPSAAHHALRAALAGLRVATAEESSLRASLAALEHSAPLPAAPGRERWQRRASMQIGANARQVTSGSNGFWAATENELQWWQPNERRPHWRASLWPQGGPGVLADTGLATRGAVVSCGRELLRIDGSQQTRIAVPDPITAITSHHGHTLVTSARHHWWLKGRNLQQIHGPSGGGLAALDATQAVLVDHAGSIHRLPTNATRPSASATLPGADVAVTALSIAPDQTRAAVGFRDGRVCILSLPELTLLTSFDGHLQAVAYCWFSADGRFLTTVPGPRAEPLITERARLLVWDLARAELEAYVELPTRSPSAAGVSPDGSRVAVTVGRDIYVYGIPSGERLTRLRINKNTQALALAFSSDHEILIANSNETVLQFGLEATPSASVGRQVTPDATPGPVELNDF
ncbi:MAG: WD40 repeat domain-containing protein [Planctomycetota bacterium]|jgi:hypothetical protein|nr:WD40 repeat domain-containing protein [Planctomycetota bacterium]